MEKNDVDSGRQCVNNIIYPQTSQKLSTISCRSFMQFRPAVHTDQIILAAPYHRGYAINTYQIRLNTQLSTLSSYTLNHEMNQTAHGAINFKFI